METKIHTVVMITDTGKEKQVRFPIDEEVYKGVKKQPKGVRKQVFAILYQNYLKENEKAEAEEKMEILNSQAEREARL